MEHQSKETAGDKRPALLNTPRQTSESWEASEAETLKLDKQKAWRSWIAKRGLRYRDCSFDNFDTNGEPKKVEAKLKAVDMLHTFCQRPDFAHKNLILIGPTGTGKDHLLASCVRMAISRQVFNIGWTSGPKLFSTMRSAMTNNESETEVIYPLISCQILVISDLAMTALTDYQREIVYQIVDSRYNNARATWVSANAVNSQALIDSTSPQIVDRLRDGATSFACNWESYRKADR